MTKSVMTSGGIKRYHSQKFTVCSRCNPACINIDYLLSFVFLAVRAMTKTEICAIHNFVRAAGTSVHHLSARIDEYRLTGLNTLILL